MPDVEQVLVAFLAAQFPAAFVCTETPASPQFESVLPVIQVVRVGGPRRYSVDKPTVVIDCFAAGASTGVTGRPAAKALAAQVADALYLTLPGTRVAGAVVGHVAEVSGPSWLPWDNTNVRRIAATYQLSLKAAF